MKYHRHKQSNKKSNNAERRNTDVVLEKEHVSIYTLATDGSGIGKLEDGSIVFVEGLLPSEKALIKIQTQKSTYKKATVINRENDAHARTTPPCPYFVQCGGCHLQHITQEKQIDFKQQWFFETLKRIGKWNSLHISHAEKRISFVYLKTDHYRRRIKLHYNGKSLGFHQKETNNIIEIDKCFIARPLINEKLTFIKNKLLEHSSELQKKYSLPKLQFDIELTESDDEKVLINFIHVQNHQLKLELHKIFAIQDEQLIHIKHPALGKFKLKKESFIQPHFNAIYNYYTHLTACVDTFLRSKNVRSKILEDKNHPLIAWDLYAGSGVFSSIPYLSAQNIGLSCTTYAVEGVKEAIDSLKLNYKDLPVTGLVQDVFEFIDEKFKQLEVKSLNFQAPHVVILDPPRSGIGIQNMQKLVELCAQESCILYLACDPASFARDTRILLEGGYHLKHVYLFDSFGQTNFYETLGFFIRGI
jgi:23S rRNA (uracil1939-C5)-methyltransferase